MMRRAFVLDQRKLGPMDYGIMCFCSALAIYSTARSIGVDRSTMVQMPILMLGLTVSFFVSRSDSKARWLKLDGVAYFILGVVAMFVAGPIGTALDGDIYHQTIATAGALEWMIVFCSFAAWRDSTLLFQFVPSMSLFGLVGCWDLYKAATVAFFVFLLGLATIFARAHGRLMMRQAELSGYSHVERLSAGPWKWIAGPEWALASAGAIIIVSLIGAPFLRETATAAGLAGTVKFQPPPTTRPLEGSLFPDRQGYVQIGRGPAILAKRPVLRVWVEGAKYLRSATYLDYVDDGWKARADASFGPRGIGSAALGRSYMREGQMISFSIEQIVPMAALPVPGEVVKINPERFLTRQGDGTYTISVTNGTGPLFTGRSLLPPDQPPPTKAATGLSSQYASLLADRSIPTKVKELADQWTAGATTDYAKARRIVDGISSRCKYNLLARPTPPGSDPVQFFLFQSKEGYCDLFASAVVLMARAEHIPARYAVGYLVNPENAQKDGSIVVGEPDAHAWAELLFEGRGWAAFDATADAQEVVGAGRGASTESNFISEWWFRYLVAPLAVAGAMFGLYTLARRRLSAASNGRDLRRDLGRAYSRFENQLLPYVGHPRRLGETPGEYVVATQTGLASAYPEAEEINRVFERLMFGLPEPPQEEVDALGPRLKAFGDSVRRVRKQGSTRL